MWVAVVSSPPTGAAAWPRLGPWAPQSGPVDSVARWSETSVAFAGEKWAFSVQFSGTEVMTVSAVHCCGCAEVMPVSMSPCCRASCATFFALLVLVWVRARKSSPCGTVSSCKREKVRPAHEKWLKMGVLWRAGRTFSRKCGWRGCAGRVFSRKCGWRGRVGRVFRGPAVVGPRRASLLRRVPGSRAVCWQC